MAILSTQLLFSDQQAITGTAVSTNVIDFGAPGTWVHATTPIVDDKGVSHIPLMVQATEDFDALTSLTITVQQATDEAFSSPVTVYTESILLADLLAGAKTAVRDVPFNTTLRYMRVNYTVVGTDPTVGKITSGVGSPIESAWGNR
jgi:hypothetical protein